MSALVLRWLNDELKLRQKVEVLERDASNGYIIAEVLHLQGLEPHFETYENLSTTAAKIHNMELLGHKFEALGVPFPVNIRRAIMMEDRSAVLQFLLQLKDFLRRRPKGRPDSAKAKVALSEEPAKVTSSTTNSDLPPRDVEERFVVATTKKFHPKEVRFHKGIDMAVHLRKFEQAQWEAENELNDFHQQAKADNGANSAAGYAAARAHLQEKAKFMRDWDREHQEKWKQTQRLYLAGERDDLRLELALEARRQIYAEVKLAESQEDAAVGVVEFEKNMNRLGLASGGAEQALRAIPANDAGSLAHFRSLEKRVDDLDFRPSNNVKMMKELRKRRKAQLAAEKDRRMRRQKALTDQKKSTEAHDTGRLQGGGPDNINNSFDADSALAPEIPVEHEPILDPRQKYLDDKRAELEENYARLRESGSAKREESMKVLEDLRSASRKKEQLRKWDVCSDAVDGLISLAMAVVSSSDRETLNITQVKKQTFLHVTPSQPTRCDQGGQEVCYELEASIQNFLLCSEVWTTLPLQSRLATFDVKSDILALAECWSRQDEPLNTSWGRSTPFVFLSVFTEDESGIELARRVSTEHRLAFLQLDPLVDECVKMSYDPQKIGDQVVSLSDRERELGAFGFKISALRQKNTALPDTMAVDIVAKAISLCRREATTPLDDTVNPPPNLVGGCVLHNFPRTLDEAKLLEKVILADLPSEESDPNTPASQEREPTIDGDKTLQASDSTSGLVRPSSSKLQSAEIQRKLTPEEEQRIRNEEQRANLEAYWCQTTRHIQIKRVGMHRDVLAELFHLCIDIYTQNSYKTIPAVVECAVDVLPEQLKEERKKKRESMSFVDRVMWMRASKDIDIPEDAFVNLMGMLQKLDESLRQRIREPMATIRSVVQAVSTLAITAEQDLENELLSGADSFTALLKQTEARLDVAKGSASQGLRERILTELEVSLGDMADFNRVAGNDFVNAFTQDPFPEVISAVDIVYQCLPSICCILKDYTMQKLELLRTNLYDRVPFLSESLQDSGRKVVLSKVLTREAMTAATELGGDKAGGGDVAQTAGGEVLNILGQVASEYSFHMADEAPAQQYALSETNVTAQEITRLLQQVALLCRFADRLRQVAGQLYASDARRLQQAVQDDIRTKDRAIADVMKAMRSRGHSTWPIRDLELDSMPGIAKRLPRIQKENFLTVVQLSSLVNACQNWEQSDPIAAGAFGGTAIGSEVFVALVLEVAAKQAFPSRWKDASAVAALTLQQCSTRGAVSWRKFVWLLLCIQFAGMPSLEDILAYEKRAMALPATKRQLAAHREVVLSAADFFHLPLWFEDRCNTQNGHNADKLKELVFQLFAATTDSSSTSAQINLSSMLLVWCVHPSCSFSVRHELEEFTPRYPRGLFRAFELLHQHCTASANAPQCISSLLSVASTSSPGEEQQQLLASLLTSSSFTSFYHHCPADLPRFFLLQNPLEALVQP
ncbi:cmgc dyrk protein kinase [Phytophthora cinnamomi]|uniref:cmgc dyrk protein kinase n=1 Tax=Phytophthora cinnamomi TaxID=4785 RepID=UPI00355A4BC7|nr:cmgc dyrk protein kinase [Phytophthora cinnamomi]